MNNFLIKMIIIFTFSFLISCSKKDDKILAFEAVQNNNLKELSALFEKNIDANIKDEKEKSILMYAIENSNPKIVLYLIKRGADVNYLQPYLLETKEVIYINTPLSLAISCNNPEIVKILCENGADLSKSFNSVEFNLKELNAITYIVAKILRENSDYFLIDYEDNPIIEYYNLILIFKYIFLVDEKNIAPQLKDYKKQFEMFNYTSEFLYYMIQNDIKGFKEYFKDEINNKYGGWRKDNSFYNGFIGAILADSNDIVQYIIEENVIDYDVIKAIYNELQKKQYDNIRNNTFYLLKNHIEKKY
ncbi:MAG: hypothetical protein A2086_04260 [Spirochaetes bacterium GWD1_27_9]|nr:MAG: hypothetical protein A2Z98_18055 [Spirochaetes bacterium GWB1_27_13]OHD23037.1 MAG: hypothetical protein A2Y34_17805 [Spirochaetes bacterium GWC1_27_15]OHD41371.1 MAG: hypothetical protein A2086_04260 [Spirochaetes bacterium GWD1_27_9]